MRIPIGVTLESRDGTVDQDAICRNALVEVKGEGDSAQAFFRKRPGISDLGLIKAGVAQLLTYWDDTVIAIQDDYISLGTNLSGTVFGGATFSSLGTANGQALASSSFVPWGPVVDASGNIFFYGDDGSGSIINRVWKSTDGGITFTEFIPSGLPTNHPVHVVVLGATIYAISYGENGFGGPYFRSVFSSSDGVAFSTITTTAGFGQRNRPAICVFNNKLWVIGGYNGSLLNDSWHSTDGLNWTQATAAAAFSARWYLSAIAVGSSLWVMGGNDGSIKNDVWTSADGATFTQATADGGMGIASGMLPLHPFTDGSVTFLPVYTSETFKLYRSITGATWTLASTPSITDNGSVRTRGRITSSGIRIWDRIGAVFDSTDLVTTGSIESNQLSVSTADLPFSAQDNGRNAPKSYLMFKNAEKAFTLDTAGTIAAITDTDYPGTYAVTLTSLTQTGGTATATTAVDTNFQVGSSVTIAGATPTDYNGAKTILTVTPATTGAITQQVEITITRSGTTATATTVREPHGLTNGQSVTISGAVQSEYNGAKTITWLSATTFSFTVTVTGVTTPATGTAVVSVSLGSYETGTVTVSGGTATVTATNHGLVTGAKVELGYSAAGASQNTWGATITVVDANTYTLTVTTADVTAVACAWRFIIQVTVSSVTSDGVVATVTTSAAHGMATGSAHKLQVTGLSPAYYFVSGSPLSIATGATTFTFPLSSIYAPIPVSGPATPATGTITFDRAATATITGANFTYAIGAGVSGTAAGTITATGGRNTVPGIPYVDGYFLVMDVNGVVYNSKEDDPSSWEPLEYTIAQAQSGTGKHLTRSLNYVVALKEWSTEFFYNAKNEPPGSPFSPVENGFTQIGCASGDSIAELDGVIYWMAQARQKGRSVYRMSGTQQEKISTPDVERILNADDLATVHAYGLKLDGHPLYVLTLVTSNITLVYDGGAWSQWSSLTLGSSKTVATLTRSGTTATATVSAGHGFSDGDPIKISGANQAEYNGIHQITYVSSTVFTFEVTGSPVTGTGTILAYPYTETYFKFSKAANLNGVDGLLHESDGHLYKLLSTVYQDNAIPINVFARTARMDGGSIGRKKMSRVYVIGDYATGTLMVRTSDDDSTTFSAYRRITLSDTKPNARRFGAFERRSMELRHIGNTALNLSALELEVGQ